jgi:hypothetical protein
LASFEVLADFSVIASEAKQSSAREARKTKSAAFVANSALCLARLPARGWIASSLRSSQ